MYGGDDDDSQQLQEATVFVGQASLISYMVTTLRGHNFLCLLSSVSLLFFLDLVRFLGAEGPE